MFSSNYFLPLQQSHLFLTVVYNPNLFERDQLFDFIIHLIVVTQELFTDFLMRPKTNFKELFGGFIDNGRFETAP